MKVKLTPSILTQLMINKHSKFNTIFINDIECTVLGIEHNFINLKPI